MDISVETKIKIDIKPNFWIQCSNFQDDETLQEIPYIENMISEMMDNNFECYYDSKTSQIIFESKQDYHYYPHSKESANVTPEKKYDINDSKKLFYQGEIFSIKNINILNDKKIKKNYLYYFRGSDYFENNNFYIVYIGNNKFKFVRLTELILYRPYEFVNSYGKNDIGWIELYKSIYPGLEYDPEEDDFKTIDRSGFIGAFYFKGVLPDIKALKNIKNPKIGDIYLVTVAGSEGFNAEFVYTDKSWIPLKN